MSSNTDTLPEYQIRQDRAGHWHAVGNGMTVSVIPEPDGKVFMRNGLRPFATEGPKHVRWLVAELDGVRVYIHDGNIVVTKKDLYP